MISPQLGKCPPADVLLLLIHISPHHALSKCTTAAAAAAAAQVCVFCCAQISLEREEGEEVHADKSAEV